MDKRIGLFGGTFNPVHLGHLRGAEEIREAFCLEEVIFIPAAIPPHKDTEEIIESKHRVEMLRRATLTNPYFSISDIELKRPGKSYSIDTIRHFSEIHRGSLFFILGGDAFSEIETWKEFKNLFSLCHFIVMTRPGSSEKNRVLKLPESLNPFLRYDPAEKAWIHASGKGVYIREITSLDISSTKIRESAEREESIRYLLPPEVESYIEKRGLYRRKP